MRARHRVMVLVAGLLAAGLVGMAVLANGLLQQAANDATAAGGDPAITARWLVAVDAAANVLWLGVGALAALLCGIGALVARTWVVADLEQLDRELVRAGQLAGRSEVERAQSRLRQLQQQVDKLTGASAAGLVAVADYRDALAEVSEQLAVADRLALTGQLALGVAHELGNPLAVAQVAADMLPTLDDEADAEERAQTATDIQEAIGRIDSVLRDMNALGIATSPADPGASPTADVAEVVAAVLRLGRLHNKVRHAALEAEGADSGSVVSARIAPGRLQQVLLNLVINAADATDGRGPIAVRWRHVDEHVAIAVHDGGPGVPIDQRARVFEPFVTTKPAEKGSGLGLAVSRRLVAAAGGTLEVGDSEPLGGAVFTVTLKGHPATA